MNGHAEPHHSPPHIPGSNATVYTSVHPYEHEIPTTIPSHKLTLRMGKKYAPSDIVKLSARDFSVSDATLQRDFSGNNNTYK